MIGRSGIARIGLQAKREFYESTKMRERQTRGCQNARVAMRDYMSKQTALGEMQDWKFEVEMQYRPIAFPDNTIEWSVRSCDAVFLPHDAVLARYMLS